MATAVNIVSTCAFFAQVFYGNPAPVIRSTQFHYCTAWGLEQTALLFLRVAWRHTAFTQPTSDSQCAPESHLFFPPLTACCLFTYSFLCTKPWVILYGILECVRVVYEAGGLQMVDVKSFLAASKITWLKRILSNDGKITKILNALCPAVKLIKDRGGEFANILMLRANNCFWVDVFKHYRNLCYRCVPLSFHDFVSERLHYNINVCRDKNVIYIRNWIESGTVSVGRNGYLSCEDLKQL